MVSNKAIVVLATIIATFLLVIPFENTHQQFLNWKQQYGIIYDSAIEETYREYIYNQNLMMVMQHNLDLSHSYKVGLNRFSDLTEKQFQQRYLQQIPNHQYHSLNEEQFTVEGGDIDWVAQGAVTSVKNQGECSSCWAFASVGTVEGLSKISFGSLKEFSVQQLIDCSGSYGNIGCNGGMISYALKYITEKGINEQSVYPYEQRKSTCKYPAGTFRISDFKEVQSCTNLLKALALKPVAAAVDASNWSHYASGIFDNCRAVLNYNVLIVGVKDGSWVVKNVWGVNWGEKGYIRLKSGNTCGICNMAYYPV